ncbi:hypothetical protein F2Q68_00044014 [Brassica cretica]|uniref:Uncharacterized protein n=1 Tax=Brassica cretica TaxID=69181 RepID=A0A8S9LNN2_BRACR|nr:hypothetical protein F2Q68_00044014 [Brassica cretica]
MIQVSLQLATVEMSTKLNIQNRSRLTLQHRSIVVTRYHMKNRSTHIQMSGRITTSTPLLTLTPDKICIQTSMMKTMRRNKPLNTEPSLMRKINSYTIPLVQGLHHRSTGRACHRSTLNLNNDAEKEHRPTLPTTNRSTLISTVCETETTRLVVGEMNTTTRAFHRNSNLHTRSR